jgi:poly(A)-specific ribonuclease
MKEHKKPLIGHNMIYDACFIYEQFIDKLPDTYSKFVDGWTAYFPYTYDTKVIALEAGASGKTELSHLFYKCTKDKKFSNNLLFQYDEKADHRFSNYGKDGAKGQQHDAGFDSYMTGYTFACLSKFIEIG